MNRTIELPIEPPDNPPSPHKPDPAEAECWLKLCEINRSNFYSRRGVEWKLALSLWGAIIAATWGLMTVDKGITLDPSISTVLGAVYGFIWAFAVGCWMCPMQHSNAQDSIDYLYFKGEIQRCLTGRKNEQKTLDERLEACKGSSAMKLIFYKLWLWLAGTSAITALLMIASWYVVSCRFPR